MYLVTGVQTCALPISGKGFLFLIFREIKLRKYSSLHKLFYGLSDIFNPNFIDKERYCFAISKNENKPEVLVTRKKYDNNNMHSRF